MARYRLSRPAIVDIDHILQTSAERWGEAARKRYGELLAAAMRKAAEEPEARLGRSREELGPGVRSLHIRHARSEHDVRAPVHVNFYRRVKPGLITVIRVLHDRMEPSRYFS